MVIDKKDIEVIPKKENRDNRYKKTHFTKETMNEIKKMLKLGASDTTIKHKLQISSATWQKWKKENIDFYNEAKSDMELLLYNKSMDLALNHNNFNALKFLMQNYLGMSDKVETKNETVQSVNISLNENEQIETLNDFFNESESEND